MSLLQKLSGFAKTFQSALLTHWRGFSNSASGLEDSHYFQWIYLIKLNSAQHLFCKIPLLFVCPGDWEPPVRLTPLTVSEHFDTRRPYSHFVILFRLYFAIVSSALHAIFSCLPGGWRGMQVAMQLIEKQSLLKNTVFIFTDFDQHGAPIDLL